MYIIKAGKEARGGHQSPWLGDIYNKYLKYKTDGFLVEFGVGHTLERFKWGNTWDGHYDARGGNNTADLLDLGWSGIYVDPIKEFCEEAKLTHVNNLDRLTIVNCGAGDIYETCRINFGETLINNSGNDLSCSYIGNNIQVKPASVILEENNCPQHIDVMSIDVEGYELKLINGLDFEKHNPSFIIIETPHVGLSNIDKELTKRDYTIVHYDSLNACYIKKL